MTTLTAHPASAPALGSEIERGQQTEHSAPQRFEPAGSSLEDLILGAWEDLGESGGAECPVCGGSMRPLGCRSCGSELA